MEVNDGESECGMDIIKFIKFTLNLQQNSSKSVQTGGANAIRSVP